MILTRDRSKPDKDALAGLGSTTPPPDWLPRGWVPALAAALITGTLYALASRSMIMLNDPVNVGAGFWPGAGISLTALLVCPRRWWPGILAAVGIAEFGTDLLSGYAMLAAVVWSAANVVQPLVAALVVQRLRAAALSDVRAVVWFIAAAVIVAPVIGGLLGALGTLLQGSTFSYGGIVLRWAIGDGLGVLTVAPAGILLLRDRHARRTLATPEAALGIVAVSVACAVVFGGGPGDLAIPYLAVPPLLWAAIRFGVAGAAATTLLVAQIANVVAGLGLGTFPAAEQIGPILSMQLYLGTITATMLVVGARTWESAGFRHEAATERRRADLEDTLSRLGKAALGSTEHEQLRRRVLPILEPLFGADAARLLDASRDGTHPDDTHPVEDAPPGDYSRQIWALLRSARSRIDTEHLLVAALDELGASTQQVRLLLESTRSGLYGIDTDGRCTFINGAGAHLLGFDDPEDLLGRDMHQLIHHTRADGSPYPADECAITQALRDREGVHRDDEVLFRRDGTSFPSEYRSHPVERDGELLGAVITFDDITDKREAQHRLQASEALFRGLFEWAKTGIAITDLEGCFTAANPALCAMVGYTEEQLLALDVATLTHPDDREESAALLARLVAGAISSYGVEKRYVRKDGSVVWVHVAVALVRDGDGAPLHTVATIEDVTARREAQERLQRSQALLRIAGALARVGGWAVEGPSYEVQWSDEVFDILERSSDEPPTLREGLARYDPADRARVVAAIEACMADGTPFDLEVAGTTFAGSPVWVRLVAEAERAQDGTITRVIGAVQDITPLRRAAEDTEKLAERLDETLESITDAVYAVDHEWRFTYVNVRAEELLQRSHGSLLGARLWDEFPALVGTELETAYHRALRLGTTQVLEEYHYPPLNAWFTIRAYPAPQGLVVYFLDVTEAREARQALVDREARLAEQAALLDKARDAIMVRDLDHRISYWNRSAELLYGWTAEEAIGRSSRELMHGDPVQFDEAMAQLLDGGEWHGELPQHAKDGSELVVESRWTLVSDDDGEPQSVLTITTDITERKRLEAQLLRAQRLESIGTLAGGLAHDLNNVLAPILLSVGLLEDEETDEQRRRLLATIASSAQRGSDMVGQILSFARGVEGRRLPVDMGALLSDVERIAEDTFLKSVRVEREAADDLWRVDGDHTQLHQVLINLCVNARDAMPDGGTIRLLADNVVVEDGDPMLPADVPPGRFVRIRVSDDGVGMPPDVIDRIFDPFFTSKPQGKGTGLGLPTSDGIVRSHGGFMGVDSEPGVGSTFCLHLPASTSSAAPPPQGGPLPSPVGQGELILVVDDEERIRSVIRRILETFGYRVLEAGDGAEAVALFTEHVSEVDAVLTDMMMPGMDGLATIRAIRSVRAGVPILATSGMHASLAAAEGGVAPRHFLTKPYTASALLHAVRELLDEGA